MRPDPLLLHKQKNQQQTEFNWQHLRPKEALPWVMRHFILHLRRYDKHIMYLPSLLCTQLTDESSDSSDNDEEYNRPSSARAPEERKPEEPEGQEEDYALLQHQPRHANSSSRPSVALSSSYASDNDSIIEETDSQGMPVGVMVSGQSFSSVTSRSTTSSTPSSSSEYLSFPRHHYYNVGRINHSISYYH